MDNDKLILKKSNSQRAFTALTWKEQRRKTQLYSENIDAVLWLYTREDQLKKFTDFFCVTVKKGFLKNSKYIHF